VTSPDDDSYQNATGFCATFGLGIGTMLMSGRVIFVLAALVCLAALFAPLIVDAQHWWPRKQLTLKAGQTFQAAIFLLCIFLALRP
jgi:hypothetical protein